MRIRSSLWAAGLLLFSAAVSAQEPFRQQLTPTGILRAGINASNALTQVVGAQMARELARRLGIDVTLVEYPNPGAVGDGAGKDWDIAFIAADPDRMTTMAFTPAYLELDATYLVRDPSIRRVADADRAGARIATGRTSAYTLVMRRQLSRAELIFPSEQEAIAGVQDGSIAAFAGLRFNLLQIAARVPGTRVLDDNITRAQQAIAVPKDNRAALAYVTSFVADVKRNGFVADAIQKTGLPGASVAP
jgi:polar amino acid transport system substrate-binding protein